MPNIWKSLGFVPKLIKDATGQHERQLLYEMQDAAGKAVGTAHYNQVLKGDKPGLYVKDIQVNPEQQRKGVASALHEMAEKEAGIPITPEPEFQTAASKALWSNPNKKFGGAAVIPMGFIPDDQFEAHSEATEQAMPINQLTPANNQANNYGLQTLTPAPELPMPQGFTPGALGPDMQPNPEFDAYQNQQAALLKAKFESVMGHPTMEDYAMRGLGGDKTADEYREFLSPQGFVGSVGAAKMVKAPASSTQIIKAIPNVVKDAPVRGVGQGVGLIDTVMPTYGKVMGKPFAEGGAVSASNPPGFIPDDQFQSHEDIYGSLGQQAITGLEGAAEGVVGPLAPLAETAMGVEEKDILARRQENPITHTVGQGVGLVGSTLAGTGMGSVMGKAGSIAAKAATTARTAEELSAMSKAAQYGHKVGSEVVKQAAEMAVLQGSDETSKMILADPDTSAQSALGNIGLSAALGGAGGAVFAGAVSPLWTATAGPKVDKFLSQVTERLNGKQVLPEALTKAEADLGITLGPEIRGANAGETGSRLFNELREAQHPSVMKAIEQHRKDITDAVIRDLKIAPEDIANYSENQAGHDLIGTLKKEYNELYAPVQSKYDRLRVDNEGVHIPDEEFLSQYSRIIEKGQEFGASGSPAQKIFDTYAERLLSQGTIGKVDKLLTEINNEKSKAWRAGDMNTYGALRDVKDSIQDFADQQIAKQAKITAQHGVENAMTHGADLIAEREAARAEYSRVSRVTERLSSELGLGDTRSAKQLMTKLAEKKSPEQVLKALSPKGNADLINFMSEHFPQTLEKIKENELKSLVRPAILGAKGEEAINLKTLSNAIEKQLAGHNEYANFVLPQQSIDKIHSARTLMEALPEFKSSGTAGWHQKLNKYLPPSALAAVSMMTGHGPAGIALHATMGGLLGGKAVPEAAKLAMLKFIASDQPIKSQGLKSMVEFMNATYKGENMLAKATTNIFKRGGQVLMASQVPSEKDLERLDKYITQLQKQPTGLLKTADNSDLGHYLPNHMTSMSQTVANAALYLQNIKPKPFQTGPLDKPIEPSQEQMARYNRALSIAQQPLVVLEHAKNGTILPTDIKDLQSMYPALYKQMAQRMTNAMISSASQEEPIAYSTRMGISLFLGQPMDSTMTPGAILSAQAANAGTQAQGQEQQAQAGTKSKGSPSKIGKTVPTYMTPSQASAAHRAERK